MKISMKNAFFRMIAVLLFVCSYHAAMAQQANLGKWIVIVDGDSYQLSLVLEKVASEESGVLKIDALYNYSSFPLRRVDVEISGKEGFEKIKLKTQGGNVIDAVKKEDGVFYGNLIQKSTGASKNVIIIREDEVGLSKKYQQTLCQALNLSLQRVRKSVVISLEFSLENGK